MQAGVQQQHVVIRELDQKARHLAQLGKAGNEAQIDKLRQKRLHAHQRLDKLRASEADAVNALALASEAVDQAEAER